MKKYMSVRTKIALMVMGLFLPTYLLTLVFAGNVYRNTQNFYMQSEQQNLQLFAERTEANLSSMIRYLDALTLSTKYPGLSSGRSEVSYQLSKTALWRDVYDLAGFFDGADMVYAAFPGWDDCFAYYRPDEISNETYQDVKTFLKTGQQYYQWEYVEIEGVGYYHYRIHSGFDMGILIRESTFLQVIEEQGKAGISYYFADAEEKEAPIGNDGRNYRITVPFLVNNRVLAEEMHINQVNEALPALVYWLFSVPFIGGLMVLLSYVFLRKIVVKPVDNLNQAIEKAKGGDSASRVQELDPSQEFHEIQTSFNEMMDNINDLRIETYELEIENQETQLMNLQLQLNPHFLMNSMNTIYSLVEVERYHDIQPYVFNLINYLRYSIGNLEAEVELRKEIEFTESYVAIQRMRFPDRFRLIYNIPEELMNQKILRLIIENLVENSVKHGAVRGKTIDIVVTVVQRENRLVITVCDNGKGMQEEVLNDIRAGNVIRDAGNNAHVGLWNCFRRLRLFYHEQAEWSVSSAPGEGTQIYINIPMMEVQHESSDH